MVSVTNGGVGPSTGSQQQFVPVLAQTDQNGAPTGGLFANNQQIAGSAVAGNTTGVVAPFTPIQAVALQGMVSGAGSFVVYAGTQYTGWGQSSDAVNLQAIINAAPAGSTIVLPRSCLLTSQVVSDKSIVGQGMGHYRFARPTDAPTIINVDSQTLSPILLTGTGIRAENFHVYNAASGGTPTAGSAITWQGTTDAQGASSVKIHRVSSFGFFDGTLTMTGDTTMYEVSSCFAGYFVRFGYLVNPTAYSGDNADGEFNNCQAIANGNRSPLAGLGWFGGGGIKIIGQKTNAEPSGAPQNNSGRAKYGILIAPKAGVATTIIELIGGSHENLQSGGVQIYADVNPSETLLAGITFGGQITGIEINGGCGGIYAGGAASYGVRVKGASGNRIKAVSVIGAKWLGGSSGVDASYVDDLTVLGNIHAGIAADSPRHINSDGTVRRLRTDYGSGDGTRTLFASSGTGASGSAFDDGNNTPFSMAWELDNIAASTNFFACVLSPFNDAIFTWAFAGIAQGGGAVYIEEKYAIYWAGSGNNPAYTLLSGTYRNSGASTTQGVCFATVGASGNTAGTVTLSINKQGSATALVGKLTLTVTGALAKADRLLV